MGPKNTATPSSRSFPFSKSATGLITLWVLTAATPHAPGAPMDLCISWPFLHSLKYQMVAGSSVALGCQTLPQALCALLILRPIS